MQPLQLAVATRCWKAPLLETIGVAADMGVQGLQFDLREELPPSSLTETGRRDFLHRLRERGLRVSSGWLPLQRPLTSEYQLERRLAFLREAMTFAFQLGAPTLCFRCGRIPEDLTQGEGRVLVEMLSDLAAYANHVGVVLGVTPSADTVEQLAGLISQIKTGPIGIDFDPAHFAMSGQPVLDALRALHARVVHVQLRDGMRDLAGGGSETAVGQGIIDWTEVIALLGEMDYRGWLTAIRTQGDDKPNDIARGLRFVKKLLLGG
ncbi:MAG: sugar phosphate isomerase/epimerase [Planctomycetaceae bacterium]|nr:sugar phosphate isomerase/epimerase [Planctomycetaceae bacterium]